MKKQLGAMGFADAMTQHLSGPRTAAFLDQLDKQVDWEDLSRPVEALMDKAPGQPGASHYPAMVMVKALVLAKCYNLSDPQLEEQLRDRLSFRRFLGLSLTDPTPDETSFVRFRARLREAGLERTLFERALAQLEARGLIVKEGTLVDATIIEAPAPRPRKKADGGTSQSHSASPSGGGGGDPDGSYTVKNGRVYFGYKAHLAEDRRGLVTDYELDTARVHDVNHLERLTRKEQKAAFADSGYLSKRRQEKLHRRGVMTGFIQKRVRGQPRLTRWQKRFNRAIASIRAVVEHPIAWMKNHGYRRVRYRGLDRNRLDLGLVLMTHNLARSIRLKPPISGEYALKLPMAIGAR